MIYKIRDKEPSKIIEKNGDNLVLTGQIDTDEAFKAENISFNFTQDVVATADYTNDEWQTLSRFYSYDDMELDNVLSLEENGQLWLPFPFQDNSKVNFQEQFFLKNISSKNILPSELITGNFPLTYDRAIVYWQANNASSSTSSGSGGVVVEKNIPYTLTDEPFYLDQKEDKHVLLSKRKGSGYTRIGTIDEIKWDQGAFLVDVLNNSGGISYLMDNAYIKSFEGGTNGYGSLVAKVLGTENVEEEGESYSYKENYARGFKVTDFSDTINFPANITTSESSVRHTAMVRSDFISGEEESVTKGAQIVDATSLNQNGFMVGIFYCFHVPEGQKAKLIADEGQSTFSIQGNSTNLTLTPNSNGYSYKFTYPYNPELNAASGTYNISTTSGFRSPEFPFEVISERSLFVLDVAQEVENDFTLSPTPITWTEDTNAEHYTYEGELNSKEGVTLKSYEVSGTDFLNISHVHKEEEQSTSQDFVIKGIKEDLLVNKAINFIQSSTSSGDLITTTEISLTDTTSPFIAISNPDIVTVNLNYGGFIQPTDISINKSFTFSQSDNNAYINISSTGSFKSEMKNNYQCQLYHYDTSSDKRGDCAGTITKGSILYQTENGLLFNSSDEDNQIILTYWGKGNDTIVIPADTSALENYFLVFAQGDIRIVFPQGVLSKLGIAGGAELDSAEEKHLKEIQVKNFNEWNTRANQLFGFKPNYALLDAVGNPITSIRANKINPLRERSLWGCNSIKTIFVSSGVKIGEGALNLSGTETVDVYYEGDSFETDYSEAYANLNNGRILNVHNNYLQLTQPNFSKTFEVKVNNASSDDKIKYFQYTIYNQLKDESYVELYKSSLVYVEGLTFTYDYFFPNETYRIDVLAHTENGEELTTTFEVEGVASKDTISQIYLPVEEEDSHFQTYVEKETFLGLFPSIDLFPSEDLFPQATSTIDWNSYDKIIILRQDLSTGRSVIISDTDKNNHLKHFKDYSVLSGKKYAYYYYCIKQENEKYLLNRYQSQEISIDFSDWVLMEVEPIEDKENIYTLRQAFSFGLNTSGGTLTNGNTPSTGVGLNKYPTVQMDSSNYWQGALSSLLGILSDEITYSQTLDMEETFRKLSNSSRKKFLKDKDGRIWEVELSAAPSIEAKEKVWVNGKYLTLKNKQLTWVQTGNADYISIIK